MIKLTGVGLLGLVQLHVIPPALWASGGLEVRPATIALPPSIQGGVYPSFNGSPGFKTGPGAKC